MEWRTQIIDSFTSWNSKLKPLLTWLDKHRGSLRRIGVVLAVLSFSALLPMLGSELLMVAVLAALAGVGVALLLLRYPFLGLLGVLVLGLGVRFSVGGGGASAISLAMPWIALLAGLWLLDMLTRQQQIKLLSSRPLIPLILFMGIAFLAFLAGQLPWIPFAQNAPLAAQVTELAIFILSAMVFLLTAHQLTQDNLKTVTWLFLLLAALYVSGQAVFNPWGQFIFNVLPRGSTGSLLWVWLVALAFSQAVLNRKLPLHWRLALGFLTIMSLIINFTRGRSWVSGWLPSLATLFTILLIISPTKLRVVLILAGLAAMPLAIPFAQEVLTQNEYSLVTRLEAWDIVLKIVRANPLLGVGPANYRFYTPLFPIRGFAVQFNSHNNYIDLLAQTGILGLAAFLWFAWEIGRLGWRIKNQTSPGFAHAYIVGALGGLAGTLVAGMLGDWVLPFVYNVGLAGFRTSVIGWIFLGGLLVIEKNLPKPAAQTYQEAAGI